MRAATRAACSPETQNAQYCTDTLAFPELSFVISPSAYMSDWLADLTDPWSVVFGRTLNPYEGLNVDHIAWPQIRDVRTHLPSKVQQAAIRLPVGSGLVHEVETVLFRGPLRHCRLQKDMHASGWAMKPKTVTSGHVSTRVCFRGSAATASTQLVKRRSRLPVPWRYW
jgi:hypothetical protein